MINNRGWNRGDKVKYVYSILSLIPVAFLFHYYEYGQYEKGQAATGLFGAWMIYIVLTGIFSSSMKKRYILLWQSISCIISLILASVLIENNGGWFTPFGRDFAVIWIATITYLGQCILRIFVRAYQGN